MKLQKKISLVFFCDDANGEYGVSHKETYNDNTPFNAFWGRGLSILHEIFEHSHEYTHKYFQGENAMNIGGEMAAMGKMWYYQYVLGLYNKRLMNPRWIGNEYDLMRLSTQDMIQECIKYGYTEYGSTLECGVPKQSPINDGEFEYQIEIYWKEANEYNFTDSYADEQKYSEEYKKSISFRKIADLHRWGYRQAEREIPNNYHNRNMLINFIDFWEEFTKNNNAKELNETFSGIDFYIYREGQNITWKAELISEYPFEIENVKLTESSNTKLYLEDYYVMEEY